MGASAGASQRGDCFASLAMTILQIIREEASGRRSKLLQGEAFVTNILSEAQIAQYRYDGYLFPFPALSADELADCNAGLARYEAWLGTPVNRADRRWRSATYVMLPCVDALVRHPRVLDVVEDLIGRDILVYTATWFIKDAQTPAFTAWHQDATYFGLTP